MAKQELLQFIATLIDNSTLKKSAARHDVAALLIEETLNLSKDEEGYNLFVLKPLFKAVVIVLNERIQELEKLEAAKSKDLENIILNYKHTLETLNRLIHSLEYKE